MKNTLIAGLLLPIFLLSACGQQQALSNTDAQELNNNVTQLSDEKSFAFEGTMFYYDGQSYDVASRVEMANSILSAVPVGKKIVIECHAGPKNGVYCIYDTQSESFEADIFGNHLIWHSDDITTAVYSFWSDVYSYNGNILKSYPLSENEFISDLTFSDDHMKLSVTITSDDGTEQVDMIDL